MSCSGDGNRSSEALTPRAGSSGGGCEELRRARRASYSNRWKQLLRIIQAGLNGKPMSHGSPGSAGAVADRTAFWPATSSADEPGLAEATQRGGVALTFFAKGSAQLAQPSNAVG